MNSQQNLAYARLVEAWKARDDLRRCNAEIRDLSAARWRLDSARTDMARVRGV